VGGGEGVPLGPWLVTARSHWQALAGVLAILAGVTLAVLAVAGLTRNESRPAVLEQPGIVATATLSPRVLLFGDPLTARFDVVVDRRRVDPDFVQLRAFFDPFRQSAETVARRDQGDLTKFEYTLTLQCLTISCLPSMTRKREFSLAVPRVVFRVPAKGGSYQATIGVDLPPVAITSRLDAEEVKAARELSPLRVLEGPTSGLVPEDAAVLVRDSSGHLPAASYRISPSLLVAILLALAALLTIAAGALVVRQLRRTGVVPPPAPPPPPPASALDHALGQLDLALANGKVGQQRKALELLAAELGHSGEAGLAQEARQLAWSDDSVARDEARSLVQTVRATVDGRDDGRSA